MSEGQERYQEWSKRVLSEWRGPYRASAVDFIEAFVVTDAMIDAGLARHPEASRRAMARNIALGIRCGAYGLFSDGTRESYGHFAAADYRRWRKD